MVIHAGNVSVQGLEDREWARGKDIAASADASDVLRSKRTGSERSRYGWYLGTSLRTERVCCSSDAEVARGKFCGGLLLAVYTYFLGNSKSGPHLICGPSLKIG